MPKSQHGFVNFLIIIGIGAVALGIIAGLVFYRSKKQVDLNPFKSPITEDPALVTSEENPNYLDELEESTFSAELNQDCEPSCQALIDKKISNLKKELLTTLNAEIAKIKSTQPVAINQPTTTQTTTSTNTPKEAYISFGVSGSTQSTSWTEVQGSSITFNKDNYPGAKGFYYQASLQSDAPDLTAYSRVLNVTNGLDVPKSEISFTGLNATLQESNTLELPTGTITLKIQIKSQIGNYATVYNPRIKVVY